MPDTPDSPDFPELPTDVELLTLPRWVCVAFAARCARRVQPLFACFRPDAPKEHVEAVDTAITLSERSAAHGTRVSAHNAVHAADAARTAYNAAAALAPDDANAPYDANARAAARAAHAAHAAARAVDAADAAAAADAADAASAAGEAAFEGDFTGAFEGAFDATVAAMRHDFELLRAAVQAENWTDDTPVPPEFFGPLWPHGEPEGWPTQHGDSRADPSDEETPGAPPLSLYFDLAEFSANEITEFIGKLSALYAEIGGDDLIIDDMRILEMALVPEEV
ncbi:MAG: hypothetical protein KIS87_09080 [Phycisphaeraceae bacterium]|nr:hypothetical protein [Phycisphaeraceae bacterium]